MRGEYTVRLGYLAVQILQIEAFSDYMRDCFADEFTWLELGQELDATWLYIGKLERDYI